MYTYFQVSAWVPHSEPEAVKLGCGGWKTEVIPAESEKLALYFFHKKYPTVKQYNKEVTVKEMEP